MPVTLDHLPVGGDFDEVIDVRAPAEFAEDHVPGALSLPVLSDAERARVGTIYVREDRFLARKVGAALVARNSATHLEGPLADRGGGWRPLVYCWRGGQRSGSFTSILQQIGWRADTVAGGYKAYRALVKAALYDDPLPHRLVVIDGGTGSAKTALLGHLAAAGAQAIDLEGLARHRGSNFGGLAEPQPSQKWFESQLADALARADRTRPVFVEAESTAIGRIKLPPSLWAAMARAETVRLDAPVAARAAHLLEAYPDLGDPALLAERIETLRPYHPRDRIAAWHALAREGRLRDLAEALVGEHYDRRYRDHSGERVRLGALALERLDAGALDAAAARLIAMTAQG